MPHSSAADLPEGELSVLFAYSKKYVYALDKLGTEEVRIKVSTDVEPPDLPKTMSPECPMAYNEGLAQRIRESLSDQPDLVEKEMFGGIGFMAQGNMVCGV